MTAPSESLGRAAELYRRGDLQAARAEAETGLAGFPDDPALLQFLGHVCCRIGDLAAGAGHLHRCLEADRANAGARVDLARALLALGNEAGALEAAEADTPMPPAAAAELAKVRAYVLQSRGRPGEAAGAYEQAVAIRPDDFEAWNNLGNARRAAGDAAGAVDALRRAAALRGDIAAIRLNLAGALAETGSAEEGLSEIERAIALAPMEAAIRIELGRMLGRLGRSEAARAAMEEGARACPNDSAVQVELGLACAAVDDLEAAEAAYRRAIALDRASPAAWNQLALLLESANRADELGDLAGEAEAAGVPAAELAFTRALHARREGRLEKALALARTAPASTEPHRKAQLIGELLDRLGDPAGAFAAFEEMNGAVAALPSRPREAARAYREGLAAETALLTPDLAARMEAGPRANGRAAPVFLVGFPRSGTTLLDTMLMGHSKVEVIEEEPLMQPVAERLGGTGRLAGLAEAEAEALRALYFETLDRLAAPDPGRTIVDKMPLNSVHAPLIHRLFPEARFIFAERHPADVVLSCFITNFRLNPAMSNFLDLEDSARLYDLVMANWFAARELFPIAVKAVRYERMVEDKEAELRPLFDWLGLEWEEQALDHRKTALERGYVASASYAQVTEPIYKRASGRWRRYEAQLEPVLPILAPWAERLGYEM